jgi:hypothetical protein
MQIDAKVSLNFGVVRLDSVGIEAVEGRMQQIEKM